MSWKKAVVRLENIDIELEAINQRLAEIAAWMKDKSVVTEAQETAQRLKNEAEQARKEQKDLEFELERVENKLKGTETRMYGGKIHNPRELADLQKEAKFLTKRKSQLEDQLLEAMITREEAEATAQEAQEHSQVVEQQWTNQYQTLEQEKKDLYANGNALTQEKQTLIPQIPESVMDSYQYLRPRMGPHVVAHLRGRTCSLCGIEASPRIQQQVREDAETYCEGCGRLLLAPS